MSFLTQFEIHLSALWSSFNLMCHLSCKMNFSDSRQVVSQKILLQNSKKWSLSCKTSHFPERFLSVSKRVITFMQKNSFPRKFFSKLKTSDQFYAKQVIPKLDQFFCQTGKRSSPTLKIVSTIYIAVHFNGQHWKDYCVFVQLTPVYASQVWDLHAVRHRSALQCWGQRQLQAGSGSAGSAANRFIHLWCLVQCFRNNCKLPPFITILPCHCEWVAEWNGRCSPANLCPRLMSPL